MHPPVAPRRAQGRQGSRRSRTRRTARNASWTFQATSRRVRLSSGPAGRGQDHVVSWTDVLRSALTTTDHESTNVWLKPKPRNEPASARSSRRRRCRRFLRHRRDRRSARRRRIDAAGRGVRGDCSSSRSDLHLTIGVSAVAGRTAGDRAPDANASPSWARSPACWQ